MTTPESTNKTFIKKTHVSDEFCGDAPTNLVVEVTPELVARIKELSDAVKAVNAYSVTEFEYSPEYKVMNYDNNGDEDNPTLDDLLGFKGTTDVNELVVTASEFHWRCALKGTSIAITSDPISLDGIGL